MGLQEKTSWFNLAVLILALIFYIILFISADIVINYYTSISLFMSASLIMILCNFAFIIFYRKSTDTTASLNKLDIGTGGKAVLYPYVFYWGAFAGILAGTSFWLPGLSSGIISKNVNAIIIICSIITGILFTVVLLKYKRMRGDSLDTGGKYSVGEIALQKVLIGYDERDLHIKKMANKISLIVTYTVLFLGAFLTVFLAVFYFGTQILSLNIVYILIIIAGIMYLKHIVIQTSTIIQYRIRS